MVQTSSPFLQALDLHLHGAWDLPLKKTQQRHWGQGASVTRENVMMLTDTVEGTSFKQSMGE